MDHLEFAILPSLISKEALVFIEQIVSVVL